MARPVVTERCIPLDARADWQDALRGIPHAFGHTWESCYAIHLTSRLPTYLYCFTKEDVRIVCPIAERTLGGHTDIVTPYGFSGFVGNRDCPDFPEHWSAFARRRGYVCGYFQLHPVFENRTYFAPAETHQYNHVYVIDLTLDPRELLARLGRTRRKEVARLGEGPDHVIVDRGAATDFFLATYSAFFRRKNAAAPYGFSEETVSFLCGLDNTLLVGAGADGRVEAAALGAYTPYCGEGLFQVSLPDRPRHAVQLVWHRVNRLKALGVPRFNLGGGIKDGDGVAAFKEQFGGTKLPLRSLRQIYRPDVFEQLCRQTGAVGHDPAGYFPPYRTPSAASRPAIGA
ncbi:MAG TPA: hypothetical protein VIG37_23055 [Methylomirabilota bacterium]|jgi:hypothetical protein